MKLERVAYQITPKRSNIGWTGRNLKQAHSGSIGIDHGTIYFLDGKLSGGEIVINTAALEVLNITDPNTNIQLVSHLLSRDFLYTEKYPQAFLEITHIHYEKDDIYHIDADMTIRGTTTTVAFNASANIQNDRAIVVAKLTVDRTKYGMRFRSGNFFKDIGINMIYNDFELFIHLAAESGKSGLTELILTNQN